MSKRRTPHMARRNPGFVRNASGMIGYYCSKCERLFWRTKGALEANCPDCGKVCKAERRNPEGDYREGQAISDSCLDRSVCKNAEQRRGWDAQWRRALRGTSGRGLETPRRVARLLRRADLRQARRGNPGRLIAEWDHPRGKAWVKLFANGDGSYSYKADGAGGVLYAKNDGSAILRMVTKLEYLAPDAYKTPMRLRANPGLGMPGMPHTWVTGKGVHVSGGDLIDYWRLGGHQPKLVRATVQSMLVFDDHVMTNGSNNGDYVDDINFIRVVRKARKKKPNLPRANPLFGPKRDVQDWLIVDRRSKKRLSVVEGTDKAKRVAQKWKKLGFKIAVFKISEEKAKSLGGYGDRAYEQNPILTVLSNPGRGRTRARRTKAKRTIVPLCPSCIRQSTSGGYEPLGPGLRAKRGRERCGAWDCVKRPHPESR